MGEPLSNHGSHAVVGDLVRLCLRGELCDVYRLVYKVEIDSPGRRYLHMQGLDSRFKDSLVRIVSRVPRNVDEG